MSDTSDTSGDQDWRLQAELELPDSGGALHGLLGRLRQPDVAEEVRKSVPDDVVITHDGKLLFAYAADRATLDAARAAIEQVLSGDGIRASIRLSHWDEDANRWRQTDPPPSASEQAAEAATDKADETEESRTLIASSGKLVRADLEQSMRSYADRLGLRCEILEHPHLLTTQVAFTVTGPRGKLAEFERALSAEEHATIRAESQVMLSGL